MNALNKYQKQIQYLKSSLVFALLATGLFLGMGNSNYLATAEAAEGKVTIIHTNDMHSHFLGYGPNHEYTPLSTGDDPTKGGIARIAGKVNSIRADRGLSGTPVVLLDGGDFMMGTAFALLGGAVELSLMNYLGYNAITIGNHEFDWTPDGTAQIYGNIPSLGLDIPVVASNLIFSGTHSGDDALKALWDADVIQSYYTETLVNGIKIGYFGLLGKDADSVAPFAYPVNFKDQVIAAQEMVTALQGEGVDLIVCLSHSGLEEDSELAAAAPGIDVIISGHTHEKTETPISIGNTLIVQAGSYTKNLGILDLDVSDSGISVDAYELVTIDDTIMGDPVAQGMVEAFKTQVDTVVLDPLGYAFSGMVAETGFDLTATAGKESNLGNLVTDAMRWMVDQVEPSDPVDFAFESNGVIRDNILMGSGVDLNIAFSDAFRALPLGFGLDGAVGYPMCTMYVYAHEVKKAVEVLATVYPLEGSDYWLNISGLRVEYMSQGIPFFRVQKLYVGNDVDGYSTTPLNTSKFNKTLYKIAINYYVAQFMIALSIGMVR